MAAVPEARKPVGTRGNRRGVKAAPRAGTARRRARAGSVHRVEVTAPLDAALRNAPGGGKRKEGLCVEVKQRTGGTPERNAGIPKPRSPCLILVDTDKVIPNVSKDLHTEAILRVLGGRLDGAL